MSTKRFNNGSISHSCKCCGACCKQEDGIAVTPLDVCNLSKHFDMNPKDFISKYCVVKEDVDVRLASPGPDNECIFLKRVIGKSEVYACSIYDLRPMACYLYPLKMVDPIPYLFECEDNPLCGFTSTPIRYDIFVNLKSRGRYFSDLTHIQRIYAVFVKYLSNPDMTEDEMLAYLYYNDTVEEMNSKIDKYLAK